MRIVHEFDVPKGIIEGSQGIVDVHDVETENIVAGVRVVHPNSDVPKRPHSHKERQIVYLISGTAKITNGKDTYSLTPGTFAVLEANEEHYIVTENEAAKLFEVRYP